MDSQEASLLHAMWFNVEMVNQPRTYTGPELCWALDSKIPETKNWRGRDGKLKVGGTSDDHQLAKTDGIAARVLAPLAYLHARNLITYEKGRGHVVVRFTAEGADRAKMRDRRFGALEVWYAERGGGLLPTVTVSALTALVTTSLTTWIPVLLRWVVRA